MGLIVEVGTQFHQTKEIVVQSRKGNHIANSQILNLYEDDFKKDIERLKQKHIGIIPRPGTVSGFYNCHGMTFANRRTGIDNLERWLLIEDCYEQIKDNSTLLSGDLVIYISDDGQEIEHSGLVISPPENISFLGTMVILSKWGSGFEVIHGLYNCPYSLSNIQFYRCIN